MELNISVNFSGEPETLNTETVWKTVHETCRQVCLSLVNTGKLSVDESREFSIEMYGVEATVTFFRSE